MRQKDFRNDIDKLEDDDREVYRKCLSCGKKSLVRYQYYDAYGIRWSEEKCFNCGYRELFQEERD